MTLHFSLASQGYFLKPVHLPESIRVKVIARQWVELDQEMRRETMPGGVVYEELQKVAKFSEIEFIISIRSSYDEPDEDGIWHDDGSRLFAFSLSLTLDHLGIVGGRLEIKKRDGSNLGSIDTPPFGTMIVFATGQSGYEHRVNRVVQGERIIIAGWCT
jgi:hypothetical protein